MGTWGDGGTLVSKPYIAWGAYINRMSSYYKGCRYDVKQRSGPAACPMNVLYWDFLDRHRERFTSHPRMSMTIRHVEKISEPELVTIRREAAAFRDLLSCDRDFAPPAVMEKRDDISRAPSIA